jgi:hypothetical protein
MIPADLPLLPSIGHHETTAPDRLSRVPWNIGMNQEAL